MRVGPDIDPADLILAVKLTTQRYHILEGGDVTTSSDSESPEVSHFLEAHGLPNPQPFASIAVFAGSIPQDSPWRGAYGTVTGYLDFEQVFPRIVVVAADDLQNAAVNRRPGRVRAVTPDRAGVETLRWAALQAVRHYAEARVAGGLRWTDFANFDTSGDFELSLAAVAKLPP